MADAHVGKDAHTTIGPTAANQTVISGSGDGLSNATVNRTFETRPIPGGGNAVRRQSLGIEDQNFPFEVDYNSVTEPLILGKQGDTLYWVHGPRGNASGAPRYRGHGILGYELSAPYNEAMRFTCTVEGDDAVTIDTYP